MRAPEFVQLCDDLCSVTGLARHQPEVRKSGLWIMKLPIDEIDVYLMHAPSVDSGMAAVVIEFGAPGRDGELRACTEMLEANYQFHGEFAPRFGRDPETDAIILQCAFGLGGTTAAQLFPRLLEMVQMARSWRQRNSGWQQ
jgi:hypothetical protein